MIPLGLGPEPPILEAKRHEWGEEYQAALSAGNRPPDRYRRDDIKEALRQETHGKCAYCESYIEHISFSHIEHLIPKSVMPELVAAWENLTLACQKCNSYKGDYFSEDAPLLNPYGDHVDEAITFYGPMAVHQTDRAKLTISKLRLNRSDLIFRRNEGLGEVLRILDLIAATKSNQALQLSLIEDLKDRLVSAAEYASCSRCFATEVAPKRGATLPSFEESGQ